jgi:sugar (pentulose or hexulose) kinase
VAPAPTKPKSLVPACQEIEQSHTSLFQTQTLDYQLGHFSWKFADAFKIRIQQQLMPKLPKDNSVTT